MRRRVFAPAADSGGRGAARPAPPQSLLHRATASRLDEMGASVLAHGRLEELWRPLLRSHASPPHNPTDERINYDELMQGLDQMPPRAAAGANYLGVASSSSGSTRSGRIDRPLLQWVYNKNALMSTRVELKAPPYDMTTRASSPEKAPSDVEDQIPKLPALASIEPRLIPYYTLTAAKILFFSTRAASRVAIRELLGSPILQFLEARRADVPEDELRANWFSSQSVEDVYYTYLEPTGLRTVMLCAAELAKYGEGGLDDALRRARLPGVQHLLLARLAAARDGLHVVPRVCARDAVHMQRPEALVYFFRLLDLNGRGVLGAFEVNYFFRAVLERLIELDGEPAPCQLEDVKDEIFDMSEAAQPHGITLADLVDCKVGHTVVGILTDANAFLAYDRREFNMHEPEGGIQ